jgi:DNA-binding NarL/FixJ family response regulator
MKITLGIVDDHQLFVSSLSNLVESYGFQVIVAAVTGQALIEQLQRLPAPPDIILVDVNMKGMNGFDVAQAVTNLYPLVRMVALSTNDDDGSIIRMLRAGCCAYLLKEIATAELEKALVEVYNTGYYNADSSNIRYRRLAHQARQQPEFQLTEKEKMFLQLACSDRTYKKIAADMNLSERTIDGYRESLFEKFKVQSRVGMALEAIRLKYVTL